MPKAKAPRFHERLLVRPGAWARSRTELPAAAGCAATLILIFIAEIGIPDSVVGILAVLPLLVATWMLSFHVARVIVAGAVLLVLGEVALGSVDFVTATAEVVAYLVIAGIVQLYASRFDLLQATQSHGSLDRLMDKLTRREREIVQLTVQGRTAPQIADLLHLSERTVETHLANAYAKLGITSKFDLVRRAAS